MSEVSINNKSELTITTPTGSFEILIGGNTDLYWRPLVKENLFTSPQKIEIIIDDSNPFVYGFIKELYDSVMCCNPYNKSEVKSSDKEKEYLIDKRREYSLREDDTIVWRSNESILETASILKISKEDKIYKLTFIKGLVGGFMYAYAINFCNSGSIYEPYHIPFYNMYINMCESLANKIKIK